MSKIAVIGGTGAKSFLEDVERREEVVTYSVRGERLRTPFRYSVGRTPSGIGVVYFNRHDVAPQEAKFKRPDAIDPRPYMVHLNRMGVEKVLVTSAVGSLNENVGERSLVIPSDYVDFTNTDVSIDEGREYSDMTDPFQLDSKLVRASREQGIRVTENGIYACYVKGPVFESHMEVRMLKTLLGGEHKPILVGMTVPGEAKLARLLGMEYGCIAVVTNLGAGIGRKRITHGGNKTVFEMVEDDVRKLMLATIDLIE